MSKKSIEMGEIDKCKVHGFFSVLFIDGRRYL